MVEQCRWKSDSGKVKSGTVKQCLWNSVGNSGTVLVQQCGGTVWWNSETVLVEQCDSGEVIVEQ